MKRLLFGLWLSVAGFFLAGASIVVTPPATSSNGGATTAALTLYVSTTGSDSNACTASGSAACLTLQGALNKVPKDLQHVVTVNVGAGTFAGAYINGFNVGNPADPNNGASLKIIGTYTAATATTGSSSGTATSGTAGSGSTHGTITQTGAGWTANQFAGKLVHTIAGTGSAQYMPIVSNDATTITIAGTWTAPAASTTFEVLDWATVISPALSRPASPLGAATATNQAFLQSGTTGDYGTSASINFNIVYEALKVAPASGGGVFIYGGTRTAIRRCWLLATGTANAVLVDSWSQGILMTANVVESSGTGSIAAVASVARLQISNNWFKGGSAGFQITSGAQNANFIGNYFSAQSSTSLLISGGLNLSQFNNNKLVGGGGSTKGISAGFNSSGQNASGMSIVTSDISGYGTGIELVGRHQFLLTSATGTGNTTALSISKGAAANVATGTTMTGTTEVSIDGTTSAYATMRAASPKLITNTYGTIFYE